jgi:hypothetical protein
MSSSIGFRNASLGCDATGIGATEAFDGPGEQFHLKFSSLL